MVENPKRWVGWIPAPTRGAGLVEFYPPLKGWVGSTPPQVFLPFCQKLRGRPAIQKDFALFAPPARRRRTGLVESGGFCGGVTPLTPLVVFASRRRHAAAVGCFRCPIHLHTLHRFGWVGGRGVTPPIPLVVAAARRRRGPLAPLPAKVLVWLAHPVVPSVFALRLVKTLPLLPAPPVIGCRTSRFG